MKVHWPFVKRDVNEWSSVECYGNGYLSRCVFIIIINVVTQTRVVLLQLERSQWASWQQCCHQSKIFKFVACREAGEMLSCFIKYRSNYYLAAWNKPFICARSAHPASPHDVSLSATWNLLSQPKALLPCPTTGRSHQGIAPLLATL